MSTNLDKQIILVVDDTSENIDALTTQRPYKKAWSIEEAVKLIDNESGKHFDPEIVLIFHKVLPKILKIKEQYAES